MNRIYIIEPSYLIRVAIRNIIHSLDNSFEVVDSPSLSDLNEKSGSADHTILFVNRDLVKNQKEFDPGEAVGKKSEVIYISTSEKNGNENGIINLNDPGEIINGKIRKIIEKLKKTRENHETKYLSKREADVLKYVALGLTNKEIADKLFLSTHTVMTHRKNISAKLGIKTIAGFTVYALLNKILLPEEVNQE